MADADTKQDPIVEMVMRETESLYTSLEARAAYRAGMGTAAAVCDLSAKRYSNRNKLDREKAAAATTCGDEIWRISKLIDAPGGNGTKGGE